MSDLTPARTPAARPALPTRPRTRAVLADIDTVLAAVDDDPPIAAPAPAPEPTHPTVTRLETMLGARRAMRRTTVADLAHAVDGARELGELLAAAVARATEAETRALAAESRAEVQGRYLAAIRAAAGGAPWEQLPAVVRRLATEATAAAPPASWPAPVVPVPAWDAPAAGPEHYRVWPPQDDPTT